MLNFILIILLALIILLFPIHLKITLKYSNKLLGISFNSKKLKLKKTLKKNSVTDVVSKSIKRILGSLTLNDIKLIVYTIKDFKFKAKLTLNTKLEYGFDDAALVAILFGLIHSIYSFLYLALTNFVNVETIDFNVIPHFKENDVNIDFLSIIYINLAKIIYMAFMIFYCFIKIKYKKLSVLKYEGGNIHG